MRDQNAVYEFQLKRKKIRHLPEAERRTSPDKIVAFLRAIGLQDEENERVIILSLDNKNNIRGYHTAAVGAGNCCSVTPVDVFRTPIMQGAAAIIFAHNHPSGCPDPSQQDIKHSIRIAEAGELLKVSVLDSIVIAENGHVSMRERGYF